MKYHDGNPPIAMLRRALVVAVVVLVSAVAEAQSRLPWHAEVAPPRPSLPRVTIDLGYPGPYIPWKNSPIALRASAGAYPFDGYIGFRFRVNGHDTYDVPVASRAALRSGQAWTFTSFVNLTRRVMPGVEQKMAENVVGRELVIEWRDRSTHVIARASAGTPPWTLWDTSSLRPLEIARSGQVFGRDAYEVRASELPDRAQWYTGFSSVVISLDAWCDLPLNVRQAVFASGIHVVLYGLPRQDQKLDELDRALLPIVIEAAPGRYVRPWPYDTAGVQLAAPISWKPKSGANGIGAGPMPYIVRSAAASWCIDDLALSRPLPSTRIVPAPFIRPPSHTIFSSVVAWPRPSQILRTYPAGVLLITALIVTIAGWLALRTHPRIAVTAVLLALACATLLTRNAIRPAVGSFRVSGRSVVASDVVAHIDETSVWGLTPTPPATVDPEWSRLSVADAEDQWQVLEIRTSETPVSMGAFYGTHDYNSLRRWLRRNEVERPPTIHTREINRDQLVVDYESSFPVDTVSASWPCGDSSCAGDVAVDGQRKGSAVIHAWHFCWNEPVESRWMGSDLRPNVKLLRRTARSIQWFDIPIDDWRGSIVLQGYPVGDHGAQWSFAMPAQRIPSGASALLDLPSIYRAYPVTLSTSAGTLELRRSANRAAADLGADAYDIPSDAVRSIVAGGGLFDVTVADAHGSDRPIYLEILETKR